MRRVIGLNLTFHFYSSTHTCTNVNSLSKYSLYRDNPTICKYIKDKHTPITVHLVSQNIREYLEEIKRTLKHLGTEHFKYKHPQTNTHTHTEIHTRTYAHTHAYIQTRTQKYTHAHRNTHAHIRTHKHTHTYIHRHTRVHPDSHTEIHTRTHRNTRTPTDTHAHTHKHRNIHTHICTRYRVSVYSDAIFRISDLGQIVSRSFRSRRLR